MVVNVKIMVFWDVAPCKLVDIYQTKRRHNLQNYRISSVALKPRADHPINARCAQPRLTVSRQISCVIW